MKRNELIESVDNAIRKLEKNHKEGKEDPELYTQQRDLLFEFRGFVIRGSKEYRMFAIGYEIKRILMSLKRIFKRKKLKQQGGNKWKPQNKKKSEQIKRY